MAEARSAQIAEGRSCDEYDGDERTRVETKLKLTVSRVLLGSESENHVDELRVGLGWVECWEGNEG